MRTGRLFNFVLGKDEKADQMMISSHGGADNSPAPENDVLSPEVNIDGIPIIRGTLVSTQWLSCGRDDPNQEYLSAVVKIRCPHCRNRRKPVYHFHGWDLANGLTALTHRIAHCHVPDSPFSRGYYIGLDLTADHIVVPGVPQYRPSRHFRRGAI